MLDKSFEVVAHLEGTLKSYIWIKRGVKIGPQRVKKYYVNWFNVGVNVCCLQMFSCLDEYCRRSHGTEEGRFASLLLRLPALRSISLKSFESLFFFHLVAEGNISGYIREALRNHAPPIDANSMM